MPGDIEKEVQAIKVVLTALEPLEPEVRSSVLGYVIRRLQVAIDTKEDVKVPNTARSLTSEAIQREAAPMQQSVPSHIKDLKEQKKPRSASEMAALVAYFLANVVDEQERKERITTKDIDTYFKIAEFPLPTKTRFTLPNAKAAGYLDPVGSGQYKLNAVGYNLVVHSMPRGGGGPAKARRAPRKR